MPIHGLAPSSKPAKPAHFDIERIIRPNILALHPYRCARDDYQEGILLDANENALGHPIPKVANDLDGSAELQSIVDLDLHRYPDPSQAELKKCIVSLRSLPSTDYVFLGVGSDEVIDLLMRVCVVPGSEKVLVTPPTYGMYAVCAQVNDIEVLKCPLRVNADGGETGEYGRFSLDVEEMKRYINAHPGIKLILLCSPGNPSGTLISLSAIRALLNYEEFTGIVVVDEAYIDFAGENASAVSLVEEYANLCILQTLSKSFGLAAVRLGMAIAQPPLIQVLTNTKAPYNISTPTSYLALSAFSPAALAKMKENIRTIIAQRARVLQSLSNLAHLGLGPSIGANDANFVLVPVLNRETHEPDNVRAQKVYTAMAEEEHVVVRYRGGEPGCKGCLRITVGTEAENAIFIRSLERVLTRVS